MMESFRPMVRTVRLRRFSCCVVAVVALFVSTVSACACAHHRSRSKSQPLSCHSASHEQAVEGDNTIDPGESLDSFCGCFVKDPVPFITAKSTEKRTNLADGTATASAGSPIVQYPRFVAQPIGISFTYEIEIAKTVGTAAPSRAPPRL